MSTVISIATSADRDRIVETLVAAFPADPVLRFLFPGDADYPRDAAAFFGHLFDKRVGMGSVWTVGGGLSVAIWEPPGTPDSGPVSLPEAAASRMRAYDAAVHARLPAEPFWYLGVLGTHPDHRGKRYGHAVMEAGLARAAAERLPAILETSEPGNVGMYQRAGWKVIAEVSEPVPVWVLRLG